MGVIESLKQRILQLSPGSFQSLCDAYLLRSGYQKPVSLGGEAGTQKTTLGTPDTYFVTANEKYVFAEYTTQKKNTYAKIRSDIEKCLDTNKTGIPHERISEIVCCHTSSNITPSQDSQLKDLCERVGIKLSLIGIDTLANDIYFLYPDLSRDFLCIPINTGQIQSRDDFIKSYNSNRMASPLDTEFLFREKELQGIDDAFQKVDVVILSGAAGTGKTRLALHYAENYTAANNEKVYCVHSNNLPIFEDLAIVINKPGNYFFLVDDANQLSGLRYIIEYTTKKQGGYNLRILITVRHYAIKKVLNDIRKITTFEIINIDTLNNEEIKQLLEVVHGITNPFYQERITRIAEGNPRIALLAGKVACNTNRLDSIYDVTELYDEYYGLYLQETAFFSNDKICMTAGVVAFLRTIHLDYIDDILIILQEKDVSRNDFLENIKMLHEQEIVDIYNDKAVIFSDQCLSNYLLKYVFCDIKHISLSEMINLCFQKHRERTITSVNTLVDVFRNQVLHNHVREEINIVWQELYSKRAPEFIEYFKVFYSVNPSEALLILQKSIEREEVSKRTDKEIKGDVIYQIEAKDIIQLLGGFADMADLPTALDLLLQYYLKRPDLQTQICNTINQCYGINKESNLNGYYTQITLFQKISDHLNKLKLDSIAVLLLTIAENFLKLQFSPIEYGINNTISLFRISLTISDEVKKYRRLIWEALFSLCENEKYRLRIREILISYGSYYEEVSIPVVQFDCEYITAILEKHYPPNKLENCLLVSSIAHALERIDFPFKASFAKYYENEDFILYCLLRGPNYEIGSDYAQYQELKKQLISENIEKCDLEMIRRLVDVSEVAFEYDKHESRIVKEGLGYVFEAVYNKEQTKNTFVEAITYYLDNDTPYSIYPYELVNNLFSLLPDSQVFEIINAREYNQKNEWLYAYYHAIPAESITVNHLYGLYEFLHDSSDSDISSATRDIGFLEKYRSVDEHVLRRSCYIILAKRSYSQDIVAAYFRMLFFENINTPQELIRKFSNNMDLLESIYRALLICDKHHDYTGKFLREIYLHRPTILDKYIEYLLCKKGHAFSDHRERHCCFFELDDYVDIYNTIFVQLVDRYSHPRITLPYFLETILLPTSNDQNLLAKQDKWIRQCILLYYSDDTKMHCLFKAIAGIDKGRKKDYILLFLEKNRQLQAFERVILAIISKSYSGSAVPLYSARIEFFESLSPHFLGLEWLNHKNYIDMQIDHQRQQIKSVQIDEIVRG